jgi:hypothetical protein
VANDEGHVAEDCVYKFENMETACSADDAHRLSRELMFRVKDVVGGNLYTSGRRNRWTIGASTGKNYTEVFSNDNLAENEQTSMTVEYYFSSTDYVDGSHGRRITRNSRRVYGR